MSRSVNNFLRQAAEGYDMEVSDVRKIFNNSSADDFYQNLELFIKERAREENGQAKN